MLDRMPPAALDAPCPVSKLGLTSANQKFGTARQQLHTMAIQLARFLAAGCKLSDSWAELQVW